MYGETVTRLRGHSAPSAYARSTSGHPVERDLDWSSPDRLEFEHVGVAPTSSIVSYGDNQAPVSTGLTLLFIGQEGLDINARDRFEIRGDSSWQVSGDPEEYISPFTGWVGGTAVKVERIAQ